MQYYRNSIPIEHIEKDTLFYLHDNLLIIADDDDNFCLPAEKYLKYFYPVDNVYFDCAK